MLSRRSFFSCVLFAAAIASPFTWPNRILAQDPPAAEEAKPPKGSPPADSATTTQAKREAALSKLLTGATLEGSFTSTGRGNPDKLRTDKYTLGQVKKLNGRTWLIEAKIQYRNSDAVMVPLQLPIDWAGDTPVIVVDNVTMYGMGTFSARVMFFDNHYMGYWKHDDRGGHLFGLVRPVGVPAGEPAPLKETAPAEEKKADR